MSDERLMVAGTLGLGIALMLAAFAFLYYALFRRQ